MDLPGSAELVFFGNKYGRFEHGVLVYIRENFHSANMPLEKGNSAYNDHI
jgi:hypothetical protein